MFAAKDKPVQPEFWIAAAQVTKPAKSTFYAKLEETLESFGFAAKVRALCAPAYKSSGAGRPGIDPVVYLKMMMVGFFENLPSERAIAARCDDSIAIREFLHYDLTEATPDHSSLSIIRQRLGGPVYEQVFTLVLSALSEHGLLRGKNLGIDSSVLEANASLRGLVNRNTGEAYWDYVKRLAAESGIDPQDSAAVRKFDRKRPKKMSNQEWENPDDPDAKIGPKKDGATDMIYKPETVVDLDSGAIVGAEILPGNQADHQEASTHILEAQLTINAARGEAADELTVETSTADKGYFEVSQLQALQHEQIKTVICDPISNRRLDKLDESEQQAVQSGAAQHPKPIRPETFAPAGHAPGAGLRPHSGLWRNAPGDLARAAEPQQALQIGGGVLQSIAVDAQPFRNRHAQTVRSDGRRRVGSGFGAFCPMVDGHCCQLDKYSIKRSRKSHLV